MLRCPRIGLALHIPGTTPSTALPMLLVGSNWSIATGWDVHLSWSVVWSIVVAVDATTSLPNSQPPIAPTIVPTGPKAEPASAPAATDDKSPTTFPAEYCF